MKGWNRKLKQIFRTAYGYHNFDHLRKRTILQLNYKTKIL
ncbi:transposase [Ligilactobacillus equi]